MPKNTKGSTSKGKSKHTESPTEPGRERLAKRPADAGVQDNSGQKMRKMAEGETPKKTRKIFCDPIHGNISMHPVCVAVIDTPEFQRLRDLKQLGFAHYVYPGAAHTRFEHSLGVCYLAGQFVRQLRENQSELDINDRDVLCLELAGLCHDLGHGPYSHVFDRKVAPLLGNKEWKHEIASQGIFDYISKKKDVLKVFTDNDLDDKDIHFIKMLITGKESGTEEKTGRGPKKDFLYEIVANKRNGIDVDKWDYIARDCHQLGIQTSFDHSRFMKFARVIAVTKDGKEKSICLRDKELLNLYELFTSRYILHKNAYQHKVICALDIMVGQALFKAKKYLFFGGLTMSTIIKDRNWVEYAKPPSPSERTENEDYSKAVKAYALLTDSILYKILATDVDSTDVDSTDMKQAQKIVTQILSREVYKCVGQTEPFQPRGAKESNSEKEDRIKKEIIQAALPTQIKDDDIFVQVVSFDFGLKEENPLDNIYVYSKQDINTVVNKRNEISQILKPYIFTEQVVRVYVSHEGKPDEIKTAWASWIENKFPEQKKNEDKKENTPDAEARITKEIIKKIEGDEVTAADFFVEIVSQELPIKDQNATDERTGTEDEGFRILYGRTEQTFNIHVTSKDEKKRKAILAAFSKWKTDFYKKKNEDKKKNTTDAEARIAGEIIKKTEVAKVTAADFFVEIVSQELLIKDQKAFDKCVDAIVTDESTHKKDEVSSSLKCYTLTEQTVNIHVTSEDANKKTAILAAFDEWKTEQTQSSGPSTQ